MIDAHCHIWSIGQAAHVWPDADLPALYRDFGMADWRAVAPEGARCVLVQAQEDEAETRWLLDVAGRNADVAGVVGWVDLLSTCSPERIAELAQDEMLKGLRPMVQDCAADWFAQPALDGAARAMAAAGLRLDALVRPQHLPALADFAARHADLPIVIDHAAKVQAGQGDMLAPLARLPQVYCKLSGLLTETPDPAQASATARHVLSLFGAERVIWGSDWPVLGLAGTYEAWLDLAKAIVPRADHGAVFGGNAARFYGIAA